jgi:putative phosphonate catabolism associated alcohol dehydrogenase
MPVDTALAAVFHAPGQPLTIDAFPIPKIEPGQTLVRIRCATICGSDLHTHTGRRISPSPSVLGHEMVGDIVATDTSHKVGDRVTWSMVWSCGTCDNCLRGLHAKCHQLYKFGHAAITPTSHFSGGFAQYCLLPAGTEIFKVPANIPDPVASIANCATATVAATLRKAAPIHGQTVVILGAGMLGLNACAMANHLGAKEVFAIDTDPHRQALATHFGAALNPPPNSAQVVLDFTGNPDAMEQGIQYLRTGGIFILAGAVFPSRPIQLPAEQIVRKCLRIEGVHNYSPNDLAAALDFLAATTYNFENLIEGHYSLNEINEAFAFAQSHKPPRVAIYPNEKP